MEMISGGFVTEVRQEHRFSALSPADAALAMRELGSSLSDQRLCAETPTSLSDSQLTNWNALQAKVRQKEVILAALITTLEDVERCSTPPHSTLLSQAESEAEVACREL